MKLYICRHGETEENVKNIAQGHLNGTLTENGKEQARKLALRLRNEKFDAIYSSPLARATDTAKIIAEFHKETSFVLDDNLKECDLGPLTGKRQSTFDYSNMPEGVEKRESMLKRAKTIIDKVYSEYPEGQVIFVAHNGILMALITVILNKDESFFRDMQSQKNVALNIFDIFEDGNHVIHLLNDDSHLG